MTTPFDVCGIIAPERVFKDGYTRKDRLREGRELLLAVLDDLAGFGVDFDVDRRKALGKVRDVVERVIFSKLNDEELFDGLFLAVMLSKAFFGFGKRIVRGEFNVFWFERGDVAFAFEHFLTFCLRDLAVLDDKRDHVFVVRTVKAELPCVFVGFIEHEKSVCKKVISVVFVPAGKQWIAGKVGKCLVKVHKKRARVLL